MTVMMLRSEHKRFYLAFVHVQLALLWYVHWTDSWNRTRPMVMLPSFVALLHRLNKVVLEK